MFSAFPYFGTDAMTVKEIEKFVLSQKFIRSERQDAVLEALVLFMDAAASRRHADRWPTTRANMSRDQWASYSVRCISLSERKQDEARKHYDVLRALICD